MRTVNVDGGGVRYLFNDLLMPLLRINRSTTSAARSVRDGPRCVANANGRTFETWRNLGEAVRRCRSLRIRQKAATMASNEVLLQTRLL